MARKVKLQEYSSDPDNVELLQLMLELDGFGLTQRELAEILKISPGQLSRVRKGERHAARKHVRTLREQLRQLTQNRKSNASTAAYLPPIVSVFGVDVEAIQRFMLRAVQNGGGGRPNLVALG